MTENDAYTSLEQLENDKSKWNLASDLKLLNTLKVTTEEISRKIQNNTSVFDDLSYKTSVCTDKINNLITDVLILTNSKFIENRVYEEDIKEIAPSKPLSYKKDDQSNTEQMVIEKLKNSIDSGIKCFNQRYGISSAEIEAPFDRNNLLSTLYKNRFTSKPLPYLIGSDDFTKDTFVGLSPKEDSDGPVIVLEQNNVYQHQHEIEAGHSSDASSDESPFHFGANPSVYPPTGKQSNGVASPDEQQYSREPLFNPIRSTHIFGSDFDDDDGDDIFTEKKILPVGNTIANHRGESVARNIVNPDVVSSNSSTASSKDKVAKSAITTGFRKTNTDFFDAISNEDSDDDLFGKQPNTNTIQPRKRADFDAKSDVSSSNNDTSSSTTANEVEKHFLGPPLASPAKKAVQSRLDSIFSSDEDEDVDIFNVSISKTSRTTNLIKPAAKISAFSSDDDDDDLFSQLKKTETNKTTTQKVEANKHVISTRAPLMPNVISELNAALKNKKVASDVEDKNDEAEEASNEHESTIASNASSNVTVQPSSERLSGENVAKAMFGHSTKKPLKFSAFSSDDDDDDLFGQFNRSSRSNSKPAPSSVSIAKTLPAEPQKVQSESKVAAAVIMPTKTTKEVTSPTEDESREKTPDEPAAKPISSTLPLMPNLMSELGATIKNRKVEKSDSSSDDESDNRTKSLSKSVITLDSNELPTPPLNQTDSSDSFSDMLKHKARLNAKRNRKRPSIKPSNHLKMASNESESEHNPDIASDTMEVIGAEPNKLAESQEKSPPPSTTTSSAPPRSTATSNSALLVTSSDESESDLFAVKPSGKGAVTAAHTAVSIKSPALLVKENQSSGSALKTTSNKSTTFLDTDDDSDSDIFGKGAASTIVTTARPPAAVSKETQRAPISLFSDSDDGEDDFLSARLTKESATTKPTQASKSALAKKSIFDDDSDSDDLFK